MRLLDSATPIIIRHLWTNQLGIAEAVGPRTLRVISRGRRFRWRIADCLGWPAQ